MLNHYRTFLILLLLIAPTNAFADFVPHPLDAAELLRTMPFIVVGTATKAVNGDTVCPQSIEITLKPEQWLKGNQKLETLQITSMPDLFLNLAKVSAGTRVLILYQVEDDQAFGVAFPMDKERDIGFAVQRYFQIQRMPHGAEKDAAFLAFAKAEFTAPQSHEILKFSIAKDLGKVATPGYREDKDLEAAVFNASQKSEVYTADALCAALAQLQSPRLVDACVVTAKRPSPWWLNRPQLAPLVAADKDVRRAITKLFAAEQIPERQWFLLTQFYKATLDDQREAYKVVWTTNKNARETITKFLKQAQSPLSDFLAELQKIE